MGVGTQKPAATAQKHTVGPPGMFPPKTMQHPRRHLSSYTFLLHWQVGGEKCRKAASLGDPHLSPSEDSTLGLFQQSLGASQGWEPGTENSQQPNRTAQPGRWQHTGASPGDRGDTGRGSVGARPVLLEAMPHREPSRPDVAATTPIRVPARGPSIPVPGVGVPLQDRERRLGPSTPRTHSPEKAKPYLCPDGRRDGWGRAGERQG